MSNKELLKQLVKEATNYTGAQLYDAFSHAETGSYENPWIRTLFAPKAGSTAFGPVQVTKTFVDDMLARPKAFAGSAGWDPKELRALQHLSYQGKLFNKYGTSKYHPTKPEGYMKQFDYGGRGQYDPANRPYYRQTMEKALTNMYKRQGSLDKLIQRWRGVGPEDDPRYYAAVRAKLLEYAKNNQTKPLTTAVM